MKVFKLFFGSLLLIMILFSSSACQKKAKKHKRQIQEQQAVVYDTSFPVDSLLTDVKTRSDSTISYALYLPSGYSIKSNWPVIFIFDAQARGKLPLRLYKNLAKKYGYILIGSNNSKNKVDWSINKDQISKLLDDAYGRFAIDKQRVYTMGFSGGARVACLVAASLTKIEGVIGCAAGFPQLDKPIENPFNYIGFSGNADFNRVEMIRLDETLTTSGVPYYIRYYQGKHDWPPVDIMNEGFIWIEFNFFKKNLSTKNETIISAYKKQIDDECTKEKKSNNIWEYYNSLKKGLVFLTGLTDISEYANKIRSLEQSESFKKLKSEQKDILNREISKQEEYRNDLGSKDIGWWKKEVAALSSKSASKNNPAESDLAKRLMNYISLISNMSVNNTLSGKQPETALFFLTIYGIVDPKNPDYHYLSACFYARQGNAEKTLSFIRNAVKYGYTDKNNLISNAAFDLLRNNKAFNDLINSIKD